MRTITFSESRAHYAETLNKVVDDCEPVTVTRANREPVVIMPLSEYESIQETLHLMRSPANTRRILEAIAEFDNGGGEVHELIDPDAAS
jgi:antitoxin YefM